MTGSPVVARFDGAIDEAPDTLLGVNVLLGATQPVDKNWGNRDTGIDVDL